MPSTCCFKVEDHLARSSNLAGSCLAYPKRNDDNKNTNDMEDQDYKLDEGKTSCKEDIEQSAEDDNQDSEECLVVRFDRVGWVVQLCKADDQTRL